jgi:hypothetical protein
VPAQASGSPHAEHEDRPESCAPGPDARG